VSFSRDEMDRPAGQDVIVASSLVALLVAAISMRFRMADEIGDTSVRQSSVAFVIGLVATLSLSIGPMWLPPSHDPRADDKGARS
jgi:hypothetical protein